MSNAMQNATPIKLNPLSLADLSKEQIIKIFKSMTESLGSLQIEMDTYNDSGSMKELEKKVKESKKKTIQKKEERNVWKMWR